MFIDLVKEKNIANLKLEFRAKIDEAISKKLVLAKQDVAVREFGINERNFKITKVKIRGGKVLRRHKESDREGYTMRNGKLVKMSQKERIKRKRSQKMAAKKRRAKKSISNINRKKSLRKRKSLGG